MNSLRLTISLLALAFTPLAHGAVKSVVLVHGAFADDSGWKPVARAKRSLRQGKADRGQSGLAISVTRMRCRIQSSLHYRILS